MSRFSQCVFNTLTIALTAFAFSVLMLLAAANNFFSEWYCVTLKSYCCVAVS